MATIYPLNLGTITRSMSGFGYGFGPEKVDVPLIGWYVETSDKKILVDTGGGDPLTAIPRAAPYYRKKEQALENALGQLGIACQDIDTVVVTHLHWDHCGGNDLFPQAEKIIQKEELESARSPFPITADGYIEKMVHDIDYTVISGDEQITNEVKIVFTPGHTYGFQGVLVSAGSGKIFIAGDTFTFFENLERTPPLISGFYVDLKQYYNSIEKIAQLSPDLILPGHDFKVFKQKVYD